MLYLYSDASFNSSAQCGATAALLLSADQRENPSTDFGALVKTQAVPASTIASLELRGLLWAMKGLPEGEPAQGQPSVTLFTDHQATAQLPLRRARLETRNFKSLRTKERLTNADLYVEFFAAIDLWNPQIQWIKGHSRASERSLDQKIFSYVDRAARHCLNERLARSAQP